MQLHPGGSAVAVAHATSSLAAGFIGLDFADDPGDLTLATADALPVGQKDCLQFATKMAIGDLVLIITHHFPFALVRVTGDYNYIKRPEPEIGVWFRHFRRVNNVRYYADRVTNAQKWEPITMTDTISILHDRESKSYRLIESWS
jgi:hypothetical protein